MRRKQLVTVHNISQNEQIRELYFHNRSDHHSFMRDFDIDAFVVVALSLSQFPDHHVVSTVLSYCGFNEEWKCCRYACSVTNGLVVWRDLNAFIQSVANFLTHLPFYRMFMILTSRVRYAEERVKPGSCILSSLTLKLECGVLWRFVWLCQMWTFCFFVCVFVFSFFSLITHTFRPFKRFFHTHLIVWMSLFSSSSSHFTISFFACSFFVTVSCMYISLITTYPFVNFFGIWSHMIREQPRVLATLIALSIMEKRTKFCCHTDSQKTEARRSPVFARVSVSFEHKQNIVW